MNTPVRFAIIGFGNIGRRHAQHIIQNPDTVLVAICDSDPSKAAPVTALHDNGKAVQFFRNADDFLKAGIADVVSICTPNYLHEPHTIAALESGHHALVEKPMAISIESCDRMIAAAERAGKRIFAVKQNRYNPPVRLVHELIQSEGLGKIYLVQVNCFWNRGDSYYSESPWRGKKAMDGGCLFTQFSHFVDILYYLAGPTRNASGLIHCYGHRHNTEIEDTGTFQLELESGAMAGFSFTTNAYGRNMEGAITIFGEKGTVKIGGQYLNTIEYQQIAGNSLPEVHIEAKSNDYGSYQGSMSNHDEVIQNVVDVLHAGKPIMVSAAEGREVVRTIEMMYDGARVIGG